MAVVTVTGASGFVGGALAAALAERGHEVHAMSRRGNGMQGLDIAAGSIDSWVDVLSGTEVVINVAGKAHDLSRPTEEQALEYRAVNAIGAGKAATAAAEVGARLFVQVSTIKVLGDAPRNGDRFLELDPRMPVGVYASSKAEGERLVEWSLEGTNTECVVVRLPLVLGTPFKGNLATLANAIRRRIPLPLGDPTIGRRSYVAPRDIDVLLDTVINFRGSLPRTLHARSIDLTAAEVARLIGREIGRAPMIMPVPVSVVRRVTALAGRPELASKLFDEMLVSDAFTRAALGFPPH